MPRGDLAPQKRRQHPDLLRSVKHDLCADQGASRSEELVFDKRKQDQKKDKCIKEKVSNTLDPRVIIFKNKQKKDRHQEQEQEIA